MASSSSSAPNPQQYDISGTGFQITPEILKQMDTTHGVPRKYMETESSAVKRVQIAEVPLSHPKSKAKMNEETPAKAKAKAKVKVLIQSIEQMEYDKSGTKRQGFETAEKTTRHKTKMGDEVVIVSNPPSEQTKKGEQQPTEQAKKRVTPSGMNIGNLKDVFENAFLIDGAVSKDDEAEYWRLKALFISGGNIKDNNKKRTAFKSKTRREMQQLYGRTLYKRFL